MICHQAGPAPVVLLVDDEEQILFSSSALLRRAGIGPVLTCADSRQVLSLLASEPVAVIVLDLFMPYRSGRDLLAQLSREFPQIPVLVMTAADEVETAVECMRLGAFDYLVKPVENARFVSGVSRALEVSALKDQLALLEQRLLSGRVEQPAAFAAIIAASKAMLTVFQYAEVVAVSRQPVLVSGETGTGKELLARAIHQVSGVPGSFVPVNVAGLDDSMFSDSLFGHRKGAFTGAAETRRGLVESAAHGTLFLDEIGDLAESSQVKLLRLLQEREYYPVGADMPKKSCARIIASTNRDLRDAVRQGTFRNDLYYRLCGHRICLPPLRERREDIPLLLDHFLSAAAASLCKKVPNYPPQLPVLLAAYHFPGNVRELQAMVHDAVARHRSGILSLASFQECVSADCAQLPAVAAPTIGSGMPLVTAADGRMPTLKEAEALLVVEALQRSGGNQGVAATLLGISRTALNKRLKRSA